MAAMSSATTILPNIQLNLLFLCFFCSSREALVFLSRPEAMASWRFLLSLDALIGIHPFQIVIVKLINKP